MAGQGVGRQIAAREIASEAIPAGVVVSGRSISKLRAQGCASDATLWNILVRLFGDTGPVAILDVNSCKKCSKECTELSLLALLKQVYCSSDNCNFTIGRHSLAFIALSRLRFPGSAPKV